MSPDQPTFVVLRPGDRVLVTLMVDPDQDEASMWAAQLSQSFPGVDFVVMGGVAGLAVQSPGRGPA